MVRIGAAGGAARPCARVGCPASVQTAPASTLIRGLLDTAERKFFVPSPVYLLINLLAFELQVVAYDSIWRRHNVIVSKPETPTPTLSSAVRYFTLAPDWHVPRSIATQEILPRLKTDPGYLERNNYAHFIIAEASSLTPIAFIGHG